MSKFGYEIHNRDDLMKYFYIFNYFASPAVGFICFFLFY